MLVGLRIRRGMSLRSGSGEEEILGCLDGISLVRCRMGIRGCIVGGKECDLEVWFDDL
jgi:hypothetical protein